MQPDFNGCAKIATLPFPRAYIQMDRLIRFAYIFSLPILLGSKVGWESVPMVSILSFGFYGLDAVATQLQDPFVSMFGDVALDGKFEEAVCSDIDSLLEKPGNAYTPEDNTEDSPSSAP
uniref:Bestrophin homolog n=1 Tax=Alexandrium andersonii TaxID=327968 RepID=A0A7S2AI84_9DINO|mmetsp:Transcript_12753/g.28911  ORF Transcript_12753/g.28911 Transcript_12753/m.28911 type:complete len:119 (+) Transcript_12753:1-357(+)